VAVCAVLPWAFLNRKVAVLHVSTFIVCCSYTKIVVKGMTKAEMILKVRRIILYVVFYCVLPLPSVFSNYSNQLVVSQFLFNQLTFSLAG